MDALSKLSNFQAFVDVLDPGNENCRPSNPENFLGSTVAYDPRANAWASTKWVTNEYID